MVGKAAERSGYFARREAAKVLRSVLQGDARRQAVASIKSLVYSPSVKNKKATFALVCQTLKHYHIIKDVIEAAGILSSKWKKQEELVYITVYDFLFGQGVLLVRGDVEKFLLRHETALQSSLARLLVRNKVKSVKDLVALNQHRDVSRPCFVRVNTLKLDVCSALDELGKQFTVQKDDMVPDLLMLPPHTDLHNHNLVLNGSVFVQGKASSMVAAILDPKPGWEVVDACSAPGNKTVHLAALMGGKGRIIACELKKDRINRLKETIRLSGSANVEVLHGDFLKLNPQDPCFAKVCAILLDPSCSGSGTVAQRLDHLLPSHDATLNVAETDRLHKLAAFQKKALSHALSFPAVERVVYSTCSVNQVENEDVVESVLPLAESLGFQLEPPFPQWQRRGLPTFDGSEHLLRTDPVEDKEGFFIALFVRKSNIRNREGNGTPKSSSTAKPPLKTHSQLKTKRFSIPIVHRRLSKYLLQSTWKPRRSKHQPIRDL